MDMDNTHEETEEEAILEKLIIRFDMVKPAKIKRCGIKDLQKSYAIALKLLLTAIMSDVDFQKVMNTYSMNEQEVRAMLKGDKKC